MLKLKTPLIIAGIMCILSMLIGLISGVRFLSILGRGLIAGVGSGGFVLCARIILERFIPDLFAPPSTVSPETTDMTDISSGANINITLDDELTAPPPTGKVESAESTTPTDIHSGNQNTETTYTAEQSTTSEKNDRQEDEDTEFSASSSLPVDSEQQNDSGLSDLPNMGSFIDDDGSDENIDNDTQTVNSGFSMTGIQTDGTDSKVMAQAIRTVLATED